MTLLINLIVTFVVVMDFFFDPQCAVRCACADENMHDLTGSAFALIYIITRRTSNLISVALN
jgi:hypothetical protein